MRCWFLELGGIEGLMLIKSQPCHTNLYTAKTDPTVLNKLYPAVLIPPFFSFTSSTYRALLSQLPLAHMEVLNTILLFFSNTIKKDGKITAEIVGYEYINLLATNY